jgi:ethanolamine utilization protein EutN
MRIAHVIGKVTLSRSEPSLKGARYLIVVPCSLEDLRERRTGGGEELIVYDDLGATEGQIIAISESAEASAPFHPDQKPIDGYCAAILDSIEIAS